MDGIPVSLRRRTAAAPAVIVAWAALTPVAPAAFSWAGEPPASRSAAAPAPGGVPLAEVAARDARWLEAARRASESLVWTDEEVRHDWRLQRRPGSDACRILDPADAVVKAGNTAECRAAFARIAATESLPAVRDETVILLHGLGEGRDSMLPLAAHLRRSLDATVLLYGYASVKADIDAHGQALARMVGALPRSTRLNFVGHSLGNLVIRRWMSVADPADLARARRVVMLGPPNQGSDLARMAARIWGVAARAEGAARDLLVEWPAVTEKLAVPPCPFGIVAGGTGTEQGFSPLLDGDDDAVVRVAETRLEGADDFLVVPVHHAAMMRHADVQRATESFLKTGRFVRPGTAGDAGPAAAP